ncbi:MAG: hypothetical protein FJY29_10425 [Betaproteobacteria bacterium]|nr:hypothetical protein [Betaproteobacteria bacterium]
MSDSNFELVIRSTWAFLENFYQQNSQINVLDFVCLADHPNARVLIDEVSEQETVFFSIELPRVLKTTLTSNSVIEMQALSVIGEEVSHFFHLVDAAQRERAVSVLQLEALAEIDRFLLFLHWNTFHPQLCLTKNFQNCSQVCDTLFEQREFKSSDPEMYRDAEALALHHLRRAFSHCWTHRHIDTSRFDPNVQSYLSDLVLNGRSALLSA